MTTKSLLLQPFDIFVELIQSVLPLLIEAVEFVEVGSFDFLTLSYLIDHLAGMPFSHILFGATVEFITHLLEPPFGSICLNILAVLLACLLMVVK